MNANPEQATRQSDPANLAILAERLAAWNALPGARVGDYLKTQDETGQPVFTRFTHAWTEMEGEPDFIQTGGGMYSQYYFGKTGCSYSGGLNSGILLRYLVPTSETRPGMVWFFDRDFRRASGGVDFMVECRVFTATENADLSRI